MVGDQLAGERVVLVVPHLEEEALGQAAGADAGRVEVLEDCERALGLLQGGPALHGLDDLGQGVLGVIGVLGEQVAVVADVVDQVLGHLVQIVRRVLEAVLVEQVVLERDGAGRRVLHRLVLAVGLGPVHDAVIGLRAVFAGHVLDVAQALELLVAPGALFLGGLLDGFPILLLLFFDDGGLGHFEDGVLEEFLLEALLKLKGGELEDFDGLDDLRGELHAKLGPLLEERFHPHLHRLYLPGAAGNHCYRG